jgi:hypothetical protein
MDTTQHDHDESVDTGSSRPDDPAVVAAAAGKTTREQRSENQRPQEPSQQHNRGPPLDDDDAHLAGDVLLGAKKIAKHIETILGVPVDEDDVYYFNRARKLPIGKYGAFLIASKKRLNNHIEKMTRGSSAA